MTDKKGRLIAATVKRPQKKRQTPPEIQETGLLYTMKSENKGIEGLILDYTEKLHRRAENTHGDAAQQYLDFLALSQEQQLEQIREAQAIEARQRREKRLEAARILDEIALETVDFPLDCLPDCLRGYVCAISEKFHFNVSAPAFCALSLIGSFAGYKFKLQSQEIGYKELYPKTGVICVAPSGAGKSPLFNFLTAPIRALEDTGKRAFHAETALFQQKIDALKQAQAELKGIDDKAKRRRKNAGAPKEETRRIKELETTIEALEQELAQTQPPAPPALYLLQPKSPEGIKRTLLNNLQNGRKNGAIIATDEASTIFTASGGVDKALDRFAQYSAILDGGVFNEITVTTRGAGEFYLPGVKFAGILTFIQPAPFARILKNDDLRDQGFYNRFVKVFTPFAQAAPTIEPIDDSAENGYFRIFEFLERTPGALFELTRNAVETFQKWRVKNQERKNAANDCADVDTVAFLSKAEGVCLCIAQTLQICDHVNRNAGADDAGADETPVETTIDAPTMERAILITDCAIDTTAACMRYLYRETNRNAAPGYCQRLSKQEEKTLELIAASGASGVTAQNIKDRINAFRGRKGTDADKLLNILLEQLRNAGEIAKRGERYFLASFVQSSGGNND